MMNSFVRPATVPLLKQAAEFNERRQQVLTANIAKIDTPGYKTRDLPVEAFQEAMKKAVPAAQIPLSSHLSKHIFTSSHRIPILADDSGTGRRRPVSRGTFPF